MEEIVNFDEKMAYEELEKGYNKAEKILGDNNKIEKFLLKLEKKLKVIPVAGEKLAIVPTMILLIRSYIKKEYTDIPLGSIIAIISALSYFLSPIDLIPDTIPIIGYLDDLAVLAACLKLVESDIEEYIKWRENNKMNENQN